MFHTVYCISDEQETLKEEGEEDVYYETEPDLMDTYLEEEVPLNSSDIDEKATEFAIANVSCQYDGSPGNNVISYFTIYIETYTVIYNLIVNRCLCRECSGNVCRFC